MDRPSTPKVDQAPPAFASSQRTSSRLNQVVSSQSQDTLPTGNEAVNLDRQDPLRLDNAFENPRDAPAPPTQDSSHQQPQGPSPRYPGSNTSSGGTLDPTGPPVDPAGPPVDPNGPPPPPQDPARPPSWGSEVVTAFKQSFRIVFCMANHLSEGSVPIELQSQPQAQPIEEVPVDVEPPQTLRQKMRGFFRFGKKRSQGDDAQGAQAQGNQTRKGKKGTEVSIVAIERCQNCSGTGVPSRP